MPSSPSPFLRSLLACALAALLPACPQSASRRPIARAEHVQAAAGALRSSGDGLLLFASDGAADTASDDGLFEMTVDRRGALGTARRVLDESGAFALQLAVGETEAAHAAWLLPTAGVGTGGDLRVSARGLDGEWRAAESLDANRLTEGDFDLACDAAGGGLLAWESDGSLVASAAGPGALFGTPVVLLGAIGTQVVAAPRVALGPSGRGIVACHWLAAPDEAELLAWSFDPGVGFAPLGRVDAAPEDSTGGLAVAAAADGTFAIAWNEPDDFGTAIVVRRVAVDGALQPLEVVWPDHGTRERLVAEFEADGSLLIAWSDGVAVNWRRSPEAGVWEAAQQSLQPAQEEQFDAVLELTGRVTALTLGVDSGGPLQVEAGRYQEGLAGAASPALATLDPVPPEFDLELLQGGPLTLAFWIFEETLEIHAWLDPTAKFGCDLFPTVGATVRFDASESAAQSTETALIAYYWDFDGDGTFETVTTERAFDHAFTAPGVVNVSLLVLDEWDDRAVTTQQVTVDGGGSGPPWLLQVVLEGAGRVYGDRDSNGDALLDIDCPDGGVEGCREIYADGLATFLTPTPDPGHHFVRWEGLSFGYFDGDYGADGCYVQMKADRTITAVFAAD